MAVVADKANSIGTTETGHDDESAIFGDDAFDDADPWEVVNEDATWAPIMPVLEQEDDPSNNPVELGIGVH